MKKTWLKKVGVVALSTVAALSVSAGVALWQSPAYAEESGAETSTIAPQTLFAAENATVTGDATKGVTIASDAAYTGTLQYVFQGDSEFKFIFPEAGTTWVDGGFKVKVTDASDVSKYFEVEYYRRTDPWATWGDPIIKSHTLACVNYNGMVRSSKYYDLSWYDSKPQGETALTSPWFRSGETNEGILQFTWENDVLSVKVNRHDNQNMRTLAAFDGTEEFVSGTSWGLPKLSFENGYVVSFSSDFTVNNVNDHGTDVEFHSLKDGETTIDLKSESMTTPSAYTAYKALEEQMKAEQAAKEAASKGYKEAIVSTTATKTGSANGLTIASDEAYTGSFIGKFQGDSEFTFGFPAQTSPAKANYFLTFTSLKNCETFTIEYAPFDEYSVCCFIHFGDEVRCIKFNDENTWYNTRKFYTTSDWSGSLVGQIFNGAVKDTRVALTWTDDVLSVKAIANNLLKTYAVFDGTKEFVSGTSWGLPKLPDMKDGYTVSFYSTAVAGTDVCFKSVTANGTSYDLTGLLTAKPAFATPVVVADGAGLTATTEGKYTLPAAKTEAGKVFLGWKDVATNELYRAGEQLSGVAENKRFEAVTVSFAMTNGASIRISGTEGDSGIRFQTNYVESEFAANAAYIKSFGTLITLAEKLTADVAFTLEDLEAGTDVVKIASTKQKDGCYTAALVQIKAENVTKKFAARAYLEIEYHDGETEYVYSAFDVDNARSIAYVAYCVKQDAEEYNKLSVSEKASVDAYAAEYQAE